MSQKPAINTKKIKKKTPVKKEPKKQKKKIQDDGSIYEPTEKEIELLEKIKNKGYETNIDNKKLQKDLEKLRGEYMNSLDPKFLEEMKTKIKTFERTNTEIKKPKKATKQKTPKPYERVKTGKYETLEDKLRLINKYNVGSENERQMINFMKNKTLKPAGKKQLNDLVNKLFNEAVKFGYDKDEEIDLEPAKKKEVKKKGIDPNELNRFYELINIQLSGKRFSKRNNNQLLNLGLTQDDIRGLNDAKRWSDFYPTPKVCIDDEGLENTISTSLTMFDPTAGLGNLLYHAWSLTDFNKDVKLTANELNNTNFELLKKIYGNNIQTYYNQNYLKMVIDKPYDLYLLNPPFSLGGDKKYYYNFYFKMLYDMNQNIRGAHQFGIFISPPLTDHGNRAGDTFDYYNILSFVSFPKLKDILNNQFEFGLTDKEIRKIKSLDYEEDEKLMEVMDNFEIAQGQFIKKCSGFGGTKITANVYLIISYRKNSGYGIN